MQKVYRAVLIAALTLGSGTCLQPAYAQVAAPPAPPAPAAVQPPGMLEGAMSRPMTRGPYVEGTSLSKEIHWVRDSAEYKAAALQAFRWGTRLVEEKAKNETSGTWAVVVDADETVLDNSQFQKEVGPDGFTPKKWEEWVKREEATAIPGAVEFLKRVKALGGHVVVVTNRRATEQAHTEAAFRKSDLPFDLMLCQTNDRYKDGRYESVEKGTAAPGLGPLKVLLYGGDNIQDFPRLRQDARLKPDGLAEFGDRFLMIPNPMYGSWVNNPER